MYDEHSKRLENVCEIGDGKLNQMGKKTFV